MRKANLHLSPMERKYIDKYKERPEITIKRLTDGGFSSNDAHEVLQHRMNVIWQDMKKAHEENKKTELEIEGCPFPT